MIAAICATFFYEHPDVFSETRTNIHMYRTTIHARWKELTNIKNRFSRRILYSEDADSLGAALHACGSKHFPCMARTCATAKLSNARLSGIDLSFPQILLVLQTFDMPILRQVNLRRNVVGRGFEPFILVQSVDLKMLS